MCQYLTHFKKLEEKLEKSKSLGEAWYCCQKIKKFCLTYFRMVSYNIEPMLVNNIIL